VLGVGVVLAVLCRSLAWAGPGRNRWSRGRRSATMGCMELVVLCGLQASGKSTFRRAYFPNHEAVSKDLMGHAKRKEASQRRLIMAALQAGRDVIVDNTNPTVEDRSAIIDIGRAHEARMVGYYFESVLADCAARNADRETSQVVPEVGLLATRSRLRVPTLDEGFDELWYVRIVDPAGLEVEPWNIETVANE